MNLRKLAFGSRPDGSGALVPITDHAFGVLRILLAISALALILIAPSVPGDSRLIPYSLIGYLLYSVCVYFFARKYTNFPRRVMQCLT